ncbi:6-phospho-beta-glucosidase [Lactobacillus colini]|uniref:6-phospho-beta-glucosidase n=1 Tax=Lactobacillus colini TaxID=1819254 RepID=A0ABS4MG53_9LACO|nr:glycoside hydrolase family 1 protein [Lactobacillus colini]MBP2058675.1 6-phospho-beta-glucosidase [Lactobacillus colini]
MTKKNTTIPDNFLWGGDISAAQIEGAWDEDGKSPVEVDYYLGGDVNTPRYAYIVNDEGDEKKVLQWSGQIPKGYKYTLKVGKIYPNHFGTDFYHHYKEDIKLLYEMGFKALNLTLSWARILPQGIAGGVNKKGVEFYRNVLLELKKYNIEPICILYKYDMPAFYVTDFGGWSNKKLIDEYYEFCRICMTEYKDLAKHWVTFNEINILTLVNDGNANTTIKDTQRVYEETHNQLVASARVVSLGHKVNPEFKVGCMVAGTAAYPLTPKPEDVLATQKFMEKNFYYFSDVIVRGEYPYYSKNIWNSLGIDLKVSDEDIKYLKDGKADFLGFSYYMSSCVSNDQSGNSNGNLVSGEKNPYLKESEWGWQIDPMGLRWFLNELAQRYDNLPLMILENGLGARDTLTEDKHVHDQYRIDYMREHIKAVEASLNDGVNIMGYTMWSCIDLVSMGTGQLSKRYGFIYIEVNEDGSGSFNRYKKDSFYWFRNVLKSNGQNLEYVVPDYNKLVH